jgi:2-polyprenyl-3-methyl-5-hydroxy-6-metoxy-1,4-benzoquinol methylase
MAFFRITHNDFEEKFNFDEFDTLHPDEWKNDNRINEAGWEDRYEYEAALINNIIDENSNIKTVLELGSGPGVLSQKIQNKHKNLTYHLIDKKYAKHYFEKQNFKGTFFEKDLSNSFDTTGLLDKYDLIITNDFLEHVLNPSIIVQTIYKLTHKDSYYFISNPNWRIIWISITNTNVS